MESEERIVKISVTDLREYHAHPFSLYSGERLNALIVDVRENGIITPLIVQPLKDGKYEILCGHNRWNAAKRAGFADVPCVIREGLSEADAAIIVTQSNLSQRSFAEFKPSEKAKSIKMYLDALKERAKANSGARNDLLKLIETGSVDDENLLGGQNVHQVKSRDIAGEQFGLNSRTISRFIRLNYLTPSLLKLVDESKIGIVPACGISYLTEQEQTILEALIVGGDYRLDVKKAENLKEQSAKKAKKGGLDEKQILRILKTDTAYKKNKSTNALPYKFLKFFPPETPKNKVDDAIIEALKFYFTAVEKGDIKSILDTKTDSETEEIEEELIAEVIEDEKEISEIVPATNEESDEESDDRF